MREQHTLHSAPEMLVNNELDCDRAADLIFYSFRFSQGKYGLQENLLRYLRRSHPDWYLPEGAYEYVWFRLGTKVGRFLNGGKEARWHAQVDTLDISRETSKWAERFCKVFRRTAVDRSGPPHKLNQTIAYDIIDADYLQLDEKQGRPRSEHRAESPLRDRYLSHFVHYSLLGHLTPMQEYTQLFRELAELVRDEFAQDGLPSPVRGKLRVVLAIHNKFHPSSAIDPNSLSLDPAQVVEEAKL